jgi:hypothetical protein
MLKQRGRLLYLMFAGSIVFSLAGVAMIGEGAKGGWGVFLFFGLGSIAYFWKLFPEFFQRASSSPELLFSNFPKAITLHSSRFRIVLALAICVILVGFGIWMLRDISLDGRLLIVVWIGVILFGAGIPFFGFLLLRKPGMQLNADGFTIGHGTASRLTLWQDVSDFEVFVHPRSGFQMVVYDDKNVRDSALKRMNVGIAARNSGLPDRFGLPLQDLAWLMNQWRKRALET